MKKRFYIAHLKDGETMKKYMVKCTMSYCTTCVVEASSKQEAEKMVMDDIMEDNKEFVCFEPQYPDYSVRAKIIRENKECD